MRGGRITPGEWERRTGLRLRFIYRRRGPSLLVAEGRLNTKGRAVASRSKTGRGVVTAPILLLIPQVKLPTKLALARDAERAHDAVPALNRQPLSRRSVVRGCPSRQGRSPRRARRAVHRRRESAAGAAWPSRSRTGC